MVEKTSKTGHKAKWLERVRHVAWAGLIALVLHVLTLFVPLDQLGWTIQSRAVSEPASGDIVFVGTMTDLSDPEEPFGRRQLADFVDRLDAAGAKAIYIDITFEQASDPATDRRLNESLRNFSGDSFMSLPLRSGLDGELRLVGNAPEVAEGVGEVAADTWMNIAGFTWDMPYEVTSGGRTLPNLAAHLAGDTKPVGTRHPVSYVFSRSSIPTYRFADLQTASADLSEFAGKSVVIGEAGLGQAAGRNIPGHISVPASIVSIYGAETLKAGYTQFINGLLVLIATFAALLLTSTFTRQGLRYAAYAIIVTAIPAALMASAVVAVRMSVADALVLLIVFGAYRARTSMRRKLRLVDPDTNLPTFAALEAEKDISENVPAIIVARIHRFEEVRRTLPVELHAEYTLAITGRLSAATQEAKIYIGQGHMIAWTMHEKDPALLREHLEGLRALFASPLKVSDEQVDVGITFGIDIAPSPNVARRLASAVAVAEKTNETFEPICIADSASQEDLIWNISLQARIDAALSNGEIYLAFQPKIMVQTGEIVGAEALVRWKDPVKGHIPPDFFIRQCETAGRMSQLTRFVLEEACKAGNAFEKEGLVLPIAVNISATLLHERSIVSMVSDVLDRHAYDPRRLTLEITETFRISNLDLAAEILGELKALGAKISMDDFGVGAASLEALLKLPFSELKIDRMFIAPMITDAKALGIVKNILQMGRDLRIIVVAEGVEDAGTLTLLRDSGCIVAQGFAISRPVRFEKILQYHKAKEIGRLKNMV
ncbi:EAL domain-containing protein [Aurantiacibacter odishensis]|uniref:EAL domain-containing protein n=1 Tax=Aurantiacibacter odishensis TaxID=1155476 RepID=UPI0013C49EBD|nr:EAL domain-containing protein [Aurantiacibacter odishensis]